MWAIDELHGTFSFWNSLSIVAAICGGQILSTIIGVLYIHTVRNHVIDTLNLLYVLRLDTKAFQIVSFGNQSKTKLHRTDVR